MLERGEIHLGQNLAHAVQTGDNRFGSYPLEAVDQLAAFHPKLPLGKGAPIPLKDLAPHRLLLLDSSYVFRRTFDAACRLAGLEPDIMFESRTPHTLLTMAESGHGVAIIPSTLRTHRYRLRFANVTYRGQSLREPLAIFWDKRRPLPRHAAGFCDMLAAYVREVFPITRPSEPQANAPMKPAKQKVSPRTRMP
jgi:DNA-binding transcriptional LysR family regulator